MIGSLDSVVLDCPEPGGLARFYRALVGGEIVVDEDDWAQIELPATQLPVVLAFQQVTDHRAPEWPGQEVPQQSHLDIRVDDLDVAERAVLAIGATATGAGSATFRVYLDPAGHPFCLVYRNG